MDAEIHSNAAQGTERPPTRRLCWRWIAGSGGILVAVCLGLWYLGPFRGPPPEVPLVDFDGMESLLAQAIRERVAAVETEPRSAAAWGQLAILYDVHGLAAPAADCYRRAMALDRRDYRWPYFLALTGVEGEHAERIEMLQCALELEPDYAPIHVYLGDQLLEANRLDEAERSYRRAIELEPRSSHAFLGLARVALAQGQMQESLEHLSKAATLNPDHGEVQVTLASIHRQLGDTNRAEQAALRAEQLPEITQLLDPVRVQIVFDEGRSSKWYAWRGQQLVKRGRVEQGLQELRTAVSLKPHHAIYHNHLGNALAAAGRLADAIKSYTVALSLDPKDAATYNNLGVALAKQQRVPEAMHRFRQAAEIDPSYSEAAKNLGDVLLAQGQPAEALGWYRKAAHGKLPDRRLSGELHAIFLRLREILLNQERIREANDALTEAQLLSPE